MDDAHARAQRALGASGIDPSTRLERAASYANEVWLGADFVLRVNFRGDLGRLEREATIIAALPPEARHPGLIGYGNDGSIEWSLIHRVEGQHLSRAWLTMDNNERDRAARQLALALQAVHSTPLPGAMGEIAPPHTLPLGPMLGLLDKVANACPNDANLLDETRSFVNDRWKAFDDSNTGLVHGDPHLENVLWDGRRLVLLDIEWSRPSWIECDLEILASFADHPWLFVSEDYQHLAVTHDYVGLLRSLASVYPGWFDHPQAVQRLAVLHISRTLGLLHENQPSKKHDLADPQDRRNHLASVLDTTSFIYTAIP